MRTHRACVSINTYLFFISFNWTRSQQSTIWFKTTRVNLLCIALRKKSIKIINHLIYKLIQLINQLTIQLAIYLELFQTLAFIDVPDTNLEQVNEY